MLPHPPRCVPGSSSHPSPLELAEPATFSQYPSARGTQLFLFLFPQMRRIWKTHNGAFYQRVLNGVIHPLCSWCDVPWFIFLDIRAVLSVPSTVRKCPVADNLLCPYVPLKKKQNNPAHNRKSLYCMPRRLGLVKYILLVNNYPI